MDRIQACGAWDGSSTLPGGTLRLCSVRALDTAKK